METIVITGAGGFIGSRLAHYLTEAGHRVICMPHKDIAPVACDRIYHLACPSSTCYMNKYTQQLIVDIIDTTRKAADICPDAVFINASSMGAGQITIDDTPQQAYNVAKRLMELYFAHGQLSWINYRLPAVYGEGMSDDAFIKRCFDGTAYYPTHPTSSYFIAHVDDVVEDLALLRPVRMERTTLGGIYDSFSTGRRGLYRPSPDAYTLS